MEKGSKKDLVSEMNILDKQFELAKEIGGKCVIAIGTINAALFIGFLSNFGIHDKYANTAMLLFGVGVFTSLMLGVNALQLFFACYEKILESTGSNDDDTKKDDTKKDDIKKDDIKKYVYKIKVLAGESLIAPIIGVLIFMVYSNYSDEGNYLLAINVLFLYMVVLGLLALYINNYSFFFRDAE